MCYSLWCNAPPTMLPAEGRRIRVKCVQVTTEKVHTDLDWAHKISIQPRPQQLKHEVKCKVAR